MTSCSPGPCTTHASDKSLENVRGSFFSMQSSAVRPLGWRPNFLHGGRRGPCSISIGLQKAQGVRKRIKQNRSNLADKRSTLTPLKQSSFHLWSLKAAASPLSGMDVTVTRECATARILARFCIHHADVDVRMWRAPCVCSDHLLLLISSTDAAETRLDAAVHHSRACAAAL